MRRLALLVLLLLPLPAFAQDGVPGVEPPAAGAAADQTAPAGPPTANAPATDAGTAEGAPANAPAAAEAEDETSRDRSYFTRLIEDNLSGRGRDIRLDGFRGALSSRATFERLTISDDQGPWLTIRNGAMAWSRAAVLTGRIQIGELAAEEIDLLRLPVTPPDAESAATPEVKPFTLPELPLAVNIGTLKADRLVLGAPILGEEVALALSGSLSLAGGEGKADIKVSRLDGPRGEFSFNGDFANATRQLALDLLVDEAAGGIVSKKIGLPGNPALTLAVSGSGPLDDFSSDIVLSTEGQPRLTGKVVLGTALAEGAAAGTTPDRTFAANLSGDVTPMLPAEYRDFFGTQVKFIATGAQRPDGAFSLSDLNIDSAAFDLKGQLDLQASGMPESFDLTATLGLPSGEAVLLPVSGEPMRVQDGRIALTYDRAQSDAWKLDGLVNTFRRGDVTVGTLALTGAGTISPNGQTPAAGGKVDFNVQGIALGDAALQQAVGPTLSGTTQFGWQEGAPLRLTGLSLNGRDLALTGDLSFDNLGQGIDVTAALDLQAQALSHYAPLAGMPLSGSAAGRVQGKMTLLTGAMDLEAQITGQDLKIGQPEVDNLLAGTSRIDASVLRDEAGLRLRRLNANARNLTATASGLLATGKSDLSAQIALPDLSVLGRGYRGAVNLNATLRDQNGERRYGANGTATRISLGDPTLDKLLAGNSTLSVDAAERGGIIRLRGLNLQNPQIQVSAQGQGDQSAGQRLNVSARLANAALLAPNFAGPVTVSGTVNETGNSYAVDLRGAGPGGTQATVNGTVATNFSTVNLAVNGRTESALANVFIQPQSIEGPVTFDLRMNGAPGLQALSGRVSVNNARFVVPTANIALQNIDLRADLGQGRVQLSGSAAMQGGGTIRVEGPITLSGAYPADLRVTLNGAHFRDPQLYDTRVSGGLRINGPLTGGGSISGALTLDETELRVPSGSIGGASAIPDISHRNEGAASRQTRARAGLLGGAQSGGGSSGGSGGGFNLDITVDAPRQIFVRGRGLDAELGGSLRLRGTTNNIIPIGSFNLIRGRLDVLAKRFELTQGNVALQGEMVPWILFEATTTQGDYNITLRLEGEATEPTLTITSSPDLPEEEVLARLLFNKGLSNLSPIQAAQLASAVASLAGKGGEGIMSRLRQNFGLDDLDVGTDDEGNTTLKAGKYISDNVYSDVTIGGKKGTTVNLNLDLTSHITARGSVAADGDSSIGLFFEKDY